MTNKKYYFIWTEENDSQLPLVLFLKETEIGGKNAIIHANMKSISMSDIEKSKKAFGNLNSDNFDIRFVVSDTLMTKLSDNLNENLNLINLSALVLELNN